MKVILLCSTAANQRALAHRLAPIVPYMEIIANQRPGPRRSPRRKALARLGRAIAGLPLRRAWFSMLGHYDRLFPTFPRPPALVVEDINDAAVSEYVRDVRPDLVIVSGTNLLKQPLIDAIGVSGKVINLHTGISPYVRGGPNCTNWCLANNRLDLIGNSIMWIDAGIDSGNLIATERTPLDHVRTLSELHITVMDHAHDLLIRCAQRFVAGGSLPNVPQRDLGTGRLYLTRDWNALAALRAVLNFHRFRRQDSQGRAGPAELTGAAPLVPLPRRGDDRLDGA